MDGNQLDPAATALGRRTAETLLADFATYCEGALIVDHEARIVWMNEGYMRRLGIDPARPAIGRPVEEILPTSRMREVVTSGKPIMVDIMDFGGEFSVVMRLPVHDADGAVIGAVGMVIIDDARELGALVSRHQQLSAELVDTRRKLDEARRSRYSFASFVGASPACMAVKDKARRAARTGSPVLLLGETGTGKELLAHAIHATSPRATAPFVALNIAAIPETLLEAEFFGVAAGAYTGAEKKGRIGKFELAHGGTLFLDEIGDMSLGLQAKLLRALQEGEIEPIGSNRLVPVDVRIIAATSRNLAAEVAGGRFRADLFYRLNVLSVEVPPLRARLDDLPLIAEALADGIARRQHEPPRSINRAALERLAAYDWPGNVRELGNVLERAWLMCDRDLIDIADIEQALPQNAPYIPTAEPAPAAALANRSLHDRLGATERQAILDALAASGGNKAQAARLLGISRASLYEKLTTYQIGT